MYVSVAVCLCLYAYRYSRHFLVVKLGESQSEFHCKCNVNFVPFFFSFFLEELTSMHFYFTKCCVSFELADSVIPTFRQALPASSILQCPKENSQDSHTHTLSLSLSLSLSHTLSLSLSLTHTHTHTHILSLSLSHTHTHTHTHLLYTDLQRK